MIRNPIRPASLRRRARTLAALALPATAALFASGCGSDWKAATVPATGKVTINGQPPAGLLVQLYPAGGKPVDARNSRPWGKVGPDGSYALSAYEDREGIPAGDYAVTLTWPADDSFGAPDRLGHRYDKPDASPWKVSVKPGEANTLPPIELAGVKVADKPRAKAQDKAVFAP